MAPISQGVSSLASSREALTRRRSSEGVETATRSDLPDISAEVVAGHDRPDDCWMIIDGKVYNVTEWVPKHPGGAMIYVRAGQDCTLLFESYHPLYVRKMLGRFLIGRLAPQEAPLKAEKGTECPRPSQLLQFSPDTGFYTALKRRVEAHFKTYKINPRVHPQMYAKAFLILVGYAASFYGAYLAPWSLGCAMLCALLLGFFTAEVGVSIQHDCNHGAFSSIPLLGYTLGLTLDLVGASSFMWKQQHVVGHHVHTNVHEFDPDIRVKDPDVRRVTMQQPRQSYHAYQHLYLLALYGLLGIKSVFVDDFSAYANGCIGPTRLARMTAAEAAIFWGGKGLYALYTFGLPALWGSRTLLQFLGLYIISQFVVGWMLALLFQVAHVVPEAQFPVPSNTAGAPKVDLSWAGMQVATSTNFAPRSFFWTHISGGLNHQIEHHLFPGVCHVYYPQIQPIVEATCKEYGVPYHCYPSYWAALHAHLSHLQDVGVAEALAQPLG